MRQVDFEIELAVLAEYQSTIRTYVNEQRTKYIIGDESDLADHDLFMKQRVQLRMP